MGAVSSGLLDSIYVASMGGKYHSTATSGIGGMSVMPASLWSTGVLAEQSPLSARGLNRYQWRHFLLASGPSDTMSNTRDSGNACFATQYGVDSKQRSNLFPFLNFGFFTNTWPPQEKT